ncbi:MiaB/RimO family radical SAM methylthiotransferase, partial [Candidatus Sumerlaeota bacterium]|nr:MiaB/RimO family radical SAM methylthiotransferase [Candidatus Sumerlaeota bacterium]
MVGCDNTCSFCIVPKTRGVEVSRPVRAILDEIGALVAQGCREVMLLGQNVNSYRGDDGSHFPALLERVDAIGGLERIRFVTSHPKDFRQPLIEAMRDLPRVMESIHLPAQAGATTTLNRMRRTHTREGYLRGIDALRGAIPPPDSAITTDLIVGFPGETEEEFQQTLSMTERVRWDSAYTFMYSPRAGTHAADTMVDDVSEEEKKRRLRILIDLQEGISAEINAALVGREEEVLFETVSRRSSDDLMGRTRTDKCVIVPAPCELIGQVCRVRISGGAAHTLFGELIEAQEATALAG